MKIIPLFLEKEGGLSRATTDTASSNPSPCAHAGKTGWHTNKGVTWGAFKENAGRLGYEASCANFIAMPQRIWTAIFKRAYWDPWGLDKVKSDVLAWTVVWWSWGSGLGGAFKSLQKFLGSRGIKVATKAEAVKALDGLAARKGDRKLFEELRAHRMAFYAGLSSAPANFKGWKNAYDKFAAFVESQAPAGGQLRKIGFGLALAAVGVLAARKLKII